MVSVARLYCLFRKTGQWASECDGGGGLGLNFRGALMYEG